MHDDDDFDPVPPKIHGAPKQIYLCYGDIESDDTHENVVRNGEVSWCEDKINASDVLYVAEAELHAAVAAERERCANLVKQMDTEGHVFYIETTGDLCEAMAARIRRG